MPGCFACRATSRSSCSSASGTSRSQTCPSRSRACSIVQMSDLHIARCFDRRFFEDVVRACLEWPADLVVMTGDLVEDDETISWVEPLLSPLEARLGKFAILGNHDKEHQPRLIADEARTGGLRDTGRTLDHARSRGNDTGDRRDVGSVGAGLRRQRRAAGRFPLAAEPFPRPFLQSPALGNRPDALGAQSRRPDPVAHSSVRSSCPAAIHADSTAAFSARTGRCCTSTRGSGANTRFAYGCPPEVSRLVLHAGVGAGRDQDRAVPHAKWVGAERKWVEG